jgi:transketolase
MVVNHKQKVKPFDTYASQRRCLRMRRRILEVSQTVPAIHIAPAFSCIEIIDAIYFGLMRGGGDTPHPDSFILSKGHGAMAQYTVLEELGILRPEDLNECGKPGGILGMHPDYGLPGIEASTGSLGHGLPLALGMALADKVFAVDRVVYVVMSDGEMQEGSNWEALLLAPSLGLTNIVATIDLNDCVSLGRISDIHPNFYPLRDKVSAFGWETVEVDGHDQQAIVDAVESRTGRKPMLVIARTIKGKGVSYMENDPIWHYRSPSPAEFQQALRELDEVQV